MRRLIKMNSKSKWSLFCACLWFLFLIIQLFYEGNTKDALFIVTLFNFLEWFKNTIVGVYGGE